MEKLKKINRVLCLVASVLLSTIVFAQKQNFQYERKITDVNGRWGNFLLPNDLYGKVKSNFSDVRIFSINSNDSSEVPYWIESTEQAPILEKIQFDILNTTHNGDGYYFTFETKDDNAINQLDVKFKEKNYDWNVQLEGSEDQSKWFTIVDNYRLLSIQNEKANYAFNTINFSNVKYRYFRLLVKTKMEVVLDEVSLLKSVEQKNTLVDYANPHYSVNTNPKEKQTKINIDLPFLMPVSAIQLFIKKDYNFFRTVSAYYVSDSFKTEKGWEYDYVPLYSGAVNSKENNILSFNNTIVQKLIVNLENADNRPLTIDSVKVGGYPYRLIGYFVDSTAKFVLRYGYTSLAAPQYDIEHFKNELPNNIPTLTLGDETKNFAQNDKVEKSIPLNKIWLWVVMVVLILLLGFFAFKMMKKTEDK